MIQRLEHVREHLAMQRYILHALASKGGQHIVTAIAPPGVVDGGHFGPGLHVHIAVTRSDDSMSLCRTGEALDSAGFDLLGHPTQKTRYFLSALAPEPNLL